MLWWCNVIIVSALSQRKREERERELDNTITLIKDSPFAPGFSFPTRGAHDLLTNWWGNTKIRRSASKAASLISGFATMFSGNFRPGKYLQVFISWKGYYCFHYWNSLDILVLSVDDLCQLSPINHLLKDPHIDILHKSLGKSSCINSDKSRYWWLEMSDLKVLRTVPVIGQLS